MWELSDILFRFVAPGVLLLVGLFHVLKPRSVWSIRRNMARSRGLATADEPDDGALRVTRARGAGFLLFAVVFHVAASLMIDKREAMEDDADRRREEFQERFLRPPGEGTTLRPDPGGPAAGN